MKRRIAAFAVVSLVALSVQAQGPVENVQATSAPAEKPSAAGRAKDFGTSSFHSAIDSFALSPYADGFNVGRSISTDGLNCAVGSTESRAVGQVILPHGVDMDFLRIWGFDGNGAEDLQVTFQSSCLPDAGAALPIRTTLALAASSGSPSEFTASDTVTGNVNVDNESCTYQVVVRFGNTNDACGFQLFFYKARIQWQRLIPTPTGRRILCRRSPWEPVLSRS